MVYNQTRSLSVRRAMLRALLFVVCVAMMKRVIMALRAPLLKTHLRVPTIRQLMSSPVVESVGGSEGVEVDYYSLPRIGNEVAFGDFGSLASQAHTGRVFTDAKTLGTPEGPKPGDVVWLRGRVSSVRAKGNACFMIIRSDAFYTVQACHFKDKEQPEVSKGLIKFAASVPLETIVDIMGVVASADVKSCSQSNVEVQIRKLYTVSRAPVVLPFLLEDASRSQTEIDATANSERPFAGVSQVCLATKKNRLRPSDWPIRPDSLSSTPTLAYIYHQDMRLNSRWLDLRVPANNAIMRIRSGVSLLFRESLMSDGFLEINSPKLIAGESEGGSDVFRTDYFGRSACLAQSPQLYKQMAISADLGRVFEIGPVFRAENSNTRRHLCEFTGLDLEMAITEHYDEALDVIHRMFKHIFSGLETRYAKELAVVRQQYPSEPVQFTEKPLVLHWPEAMAMLRQAGVQVDDMADLSSAIELQLGQLVKEKYQADFFILDQYPSAVRPFYTMLNASNPLFSNSYDIFIRGQEICSGAQRCHDAAQLERQIVAKGINTEPLQFYIEAFKHGVPPHAGAGIGLERVVFLYLGLDNVRKASLFPRDPGRCSP